MERQAEMCPLVEVEYKDGHKEIVQSHVTLFIKHLYKPHRLIFEPVVTNKKLAVAIQNEQVVKVTNVSRGE